MPSARRDMLAKILLSAASLLLAHLLHFLCSLMQFIPGKMHEKQSLSSHPLGKRVAAAAAADTGRGSDSYCQKL